MDDYSFNLACLESTDPEKQIAGLAFFAVCDDSLLSDHAVNRLIYLAENGQKNVAEIASSVISNAVSRREREAVTSRLLKKLKKASETEITLRDLELAVKIRAEEMKAALEGYLDRCSEPRHISWLVKNLPREFPDPDQIPLLKSFLTYGDDRIVSNTIEGLEFISEPGLIGVFAQMLNHASHRVRSVAAAAISRADPENARKILFGMLHQPDRIDSIKAACHAIRHLAGKDFTDLVLPLLANEKTRDEAARTVAWLAFRKIDNIFDNDVFKNRHEIKARVTASLIELLREQCRQSSFLHSDQDQAESGGCSLSIAEKNILAFFPTLSMAEALKKAEENKHRCLSFFSRIIYRPKDEEIRLSGSTAQYLPFWQIEFAANVEYVREKPLKLDLDKSVTEIKIGDQYFKVKDGNLKLKIDEKCSVSQQQTSCIDAITGEQIDPGEMLSAGSKTLNNISELISNDFEVIPPRLRASIPVRNMIHGLMQPLKAIEILSQTLNIQKLNLCFRPVYTFEYLWENRKQSVSFCIDGVTGRIYEGNSIIQGDESRISEASLFDIGADAIGLVVPGGDIAAKIAMAFLGKKK